MASRTSSSVKVKVTASLDAELVETIDEFLKESGNCSRSQLIEDALRKWQKEQKRQKIESQIEEYYLSLSDKEQEEERNWREIATQSAHHLWEE
jgi:metal-responsive CopG/Arc/MetJ family transcriptional regulator